MQAGEEKNENRSDCTEGLDGEAARLCGDGAANMIVIRKSPSPW